MIGLNLKEQFLDALARDQADMGPVSLRKIYTALDLAAGLYVRETQGIRQTATITTVEDQQLYDLPTDFVRPYARKCRGYMKQRVLVAKYDAGDCVAWPVLTSYEQIFRANYSTSRETPRCFCIQPKVSAEAAVSGTASAAGAVAAGEAVLTDGSADFVSAGVGVRDVVINTTRNSAGVVLAVVSATQVRCALFPEGVNSWRDGDGYRIQPEARKQVCLDAPSAVAGHTFLLPYLAQPAPVFSDLGSWRLDDTACRAIAFEAAYLHSLSDKKLKANPAHHAMFVDAVKAERLRMAKASMEGV